jgi:bilirubin oxidase
MILFGLFFHKGFAQNPLLIPPALTGTTFDLTVQSGSQVFYDTTSTPSFGINGVWMAPTIIVNKHDSITLNVINNLNVNTTMHWHGVHVSAMNDGGPHQLVSPSTTWSPSFTIRNNAATYWYHPHGAGQTELQVLKGLAGFFIIKDLTEAALDLPRTYGIDDFPILIQTKSFDVLKQFAIASEMDTSIFINGTLNPYLEVPAQIVRFRFLNGSSLRTFNLGFENNETFYQIASDGGLLDSSIALNRFRISTGERAEILIDFSGMNGQSLYLKSYASELPKGIYGADSVGNGNDTIPEYSENFLNGADFNLLQINVVDTTIDPINSIPDPLVKVLPYEISEATNHRTIVMDTIRLLSIDVPNLAEGPFGMNNQTFNMDSINEIVYLNTTEIWTLKNNTLVAHPFHIHDVQFNVIERSGTTPPANEQGWKDVVLVMPEDSVKFLTRFETFSDHTTPYMYHCHLLHHEDDGMMGSFLVVDSTYSNIHTAGNNLNTINIFPNPASCYIQLAIPVQNQTYELEIINVLGECVLELKNWKPSLLNIENMYTGVYQVFVRNKHDILKSKFVKY